MVKFTLAIADSHSLKDKRMVVRRIKDRLRERVGVFASEVGAQDVWQRAELGVAVASGDRGKARELLDEVVRVAVAAGGAEIVAIAKDVTTFDAAAAPIAIEPTLGLDRTGSGDKAVGGDDWIPDAWRKDAEP